MRPGLSIKVANEYTIRGLSDEKSLALRHLTLHYPHQEEVNRSELIVNFPSGEYKIMMSA